MLIASSDRRFEESRVQSMLVLERRFRLLVLHRDKLLFDSRFSPAARKGAGGTTVYFVLAGSFQVGDGPVMQAPLAFVLADDELERVTPTSRTFRAWGAPFVNIELRLVDGDVRRPIGLAAGPLSLSASTWSRCAAFAANCAAGEPDERTVRAWLEDLAAEGLFAPEVVASIVDPEPEPFRRLWTKLRAFYENHATNTSILEIKRATGLSLRQLVRDLAGMTRAFGLGGSYRDTMRVLRLRAAIVLLSAPHGTATDVASQVGYKSIDAMGRAFREAGLPPPSVVQDTIRFDAVR